MSGNNENAEQDLEAAVFSRMLEDAHLVHEILSFAGRLIGTTGNTDDVDIIGDMTFLECQTLDAFAFCCEGCGWWFAASERHEVSDRWYCGDCKNDL